MNFPTNESVRADIGPTKCSPLAGPRKAVTGAMLLAGVAMSLIGCGTTPRSTPAPTGQIEQLYIDYRAKRYRQVYDRAARLRRSASPPTSREAGYLAGLAAVRLGRSQDALAHLSHAAQSGDADLASRARAEIGLLHAERQRFHLAEQYLLEAGPGLEGNDRAQAYLHAAIAQQNLGRWDRARETLATAKRAARSSRLRNIIANRENYRALALQVGAFADRSNASNLARQVAERARAFGIGHATVTTTTSDRGRLYAVRVGRFGSYAQATRARKQLEQWGAFVLPVR